MGNYYIIATKEELKNYPLVQELMSDAVWNQIVYYAGVEDCVPRTIRVQRLSDSMYHIYHMHKDSESYLIEFAEEGDYEYMNQLYLVDNLFQKIKNRISTTIYDSDITKALNGLTTTLKLFDISLYDIREENFEKDILDFKSKIGTEFHFVSNFVGWSTDGMRPITIVTVAIVNDNSIRVKMVYVLESIQDENGIHEIVDYVSINDKEVTDSDKIKEVVSDIHEALIRNKK